MLLYSPALPVVWTSVVLLTTPELQAVQLNVIGVMAVFRCTSSVDTLGISPQSTFMEKVVKAEVLVVLAQTVYCVSSVNTLGVP